MENDKSELMDYDSFLDKWAEVVFKKADKAIEELEYLPYEYKRGLLKGYSDGLYMAVSILTRMEQKKRA